MKEILEDRSHHELKTQSKSLEEWERYLEFRIQSRVLFKLFEELLYVAAQVDPLGLLKPISEVELEIPSNWLQEESTQPASRAVTDDHGYDVDILNNELMQFKKLHERVRKLVSEVEPLSLRGVKEELEKFREQFRCCREESFFLYLGSFKGIRDFDETQLSRLFKSVFRLEAMVDPSGQKKYILRESKIPFRWLALP